MKKLFTFFTLAVMGFVAAFAADAEESEVATLVVDVIDENKAAVEDAYVTIYNVEGSTDANGRAVLSVELSEVAGKSVPVTVYKDGYEFFETEVEFEENTVKLTVELKASEATLTIIAIAGEEPVEGAYVTFNGEEYTTNASGTVKITGLSAPDVIGKTFPVTIYKDGYAFYEGVADFSETMDAYVMAELEAEEASLTIIVFADEEPVEGAYVTFNGEEYTTNANGNVKVTGISAPDVLGKTLPVTIYKDGYAFYEGEADFTETMDAFLVVELEAEEASLTIIAIADEEPVEGAFVTFNGNEYTTNANGNVKVTGLSAPAVLGKTFPVTIYKDGYEFYEGVADFSETMDAYVVAELQAAAASLTIKVMAGDDPVEGAYIVFDGKEYSSDAYGSIKITDISAPSVIGTTIPVTVYKDGYVPFEGVADFSETIDAYVVAQLEADEATLTIKVFADAEPIEGAFVTFEGKEYTSDESGEVKITGISAPSVIGKTLPVSIYKDGYVPFEGEADFTEGFDAWVIAELEADEASLTIKVIADEEPVEGAVVTFNGEEYTTDANGDVKITGISAPAVIGQTFPVTVSKEGYETYEGEADFTETMDAFVVVELVNIQTGINAIINDIENGDVKVYDLNGRSVVNPQNGQIYIVNGQKVLLNR